MPARCTRAIRAASPRPTRPGRFSVPQRCRDSWPPPRMKARSSATPSASTIAPVPFGAANLCPDRVRASRPSPAKSRGIFPTRLHCVAMDEGTAMRFGQGDDLGEGLDHAGLVVGRMDGDQHRFVARSLQGLLQCGQVDQAGGVNRYDLHRSGREAVSRPDAGMLGGAHQETCRRRGSGPDQSARQDCIRRLGAAAGEDDAALASADQGGDLVARGLQRSLGGTALVMDRRGVAGQFQRARDRYRHLRTNRRCRVVIEIGARNSHALVKARTHISLLLPPVIMLRPRHHTSSPSAEPRGATDPKSLETSQFRIILII